MRRYHLKKKQKNNQNHYHHHHHHQVIRKPFSQGGPGWPGSSGRPLCEPVERCPVRWSPPSPIPAALLLKVPPGTGSSCLSFSPQTHPLPLGGTELWPEPAELEPGWDCHLMGLEWTTLGGKTLEVVHSGLVLARVLHIRREHCCRFEVER